MANSLADNGSQNASNSVGFACDGAFLGVLRHGDVS